MYLGPLKLRAIELFQPVSLHRRKMHGVIHTYSNDFDVCSLILSHQIVSSLSVEKSFSCARVNIEQIKVRVLLSIGFCAHFC